MGQCFSGKGKSKEESNPISASSNHSVEKEAAPLPQETQNQACFGAGLMALLTSIIQA